MDLRSRVAVIIGAMLLWFVPTISAHAATVTTVDFYCITPNNATNCSTGVTQLSVRVSDPGVNLITGAPRALFHFKNLTGGSASSITDVYFDDGTLLDLSSITNGAGVSFAELATPANLPGGNNITPAFQTTKGFSADSDAPVQPSGVNPGEWVKVYFDLKPNGTYNDVISELGDGRLRIGVHVQGFSTGSSASFVNNFVPAPVPVPPAVWLFGSGLLSLLGIARRRQIKN
jgi:hypothetical protein